MNLEFGILFFILAFILSLSVLVYFNNPKNKTNRLFAIMACWMIIWMASNFLENETQNLKLANLFLKIDFASAAILVYYWFLFCLNFPQPKESFSWITKASILAPTICFALLSFSDLVIKDIRIDDRIIFNEGILFPIYAIYVLFYMIIGGCGYLAFKYYKLKDKRDIQKTQILYVLLGLFISGSVAVIINLFLQRVLPVELFRIGTYIVIFIPGFTAYAIVTKRLFNIKTVATELFVLATWVVLLIKTFLSKDIQDTIANGSILVAVIFLGILIIRSVLNEVRQKEQIAKMASEVEKAYQIERRAHEELEQIDKIKNKFLMQTQHDLKSPLSTIRGYCELLIGGSLGKQSKKTIEALQRIQVVAEDKIRDVNNFLDVSQFKLGRGVIKLEDNVDMPVMIEEIVNNLKLKSEEKGIYLKFERSKEEIIVKADREKLKSAIFNIADNAVKYTKEGGVTIKLQVAGSVLQIIISDTGIGIPVDKIENIFETQFDRTEQAQKTASGSGVGLYLANQIIKGHNGKIWVESEGENKGSVFHIELPIN